MRISDWSSDVCSSDLRALEEAGLPVDPALVVPAHFEIEFAEAAVDTLIARQVDFDAIFAASDMIALGAIRSLLHAGCSVPGDVSVRSDEHTSELQSLMRISYAVFCLKKKKTQTQNIK